MYLTSTEHTLRDLERFVETDLVKIRALWTYTRQVENDVALGLLRIARHARWLRTVIGKHMQSLIPRGTGLSARLTTGILAQTFLDKASTNDLLSEGNAGGNRTRSVWLAAMVNGTSFLKEQNVEVLLGITQGMCIHKTRLRQHLYSL
jgi:hypothetical protein